MIARWPAAISGALAEAVVLLVRLYQATLSPLIGRQCRFVPTCSNYLIDAVRKCGLLRGLAMGFWRVLRCNPLGKGGYDPVECARKAHSRQAGTEKAQNPS